MTERGIVMYGADSCADCQDQKTLFGDDFQFINYVNCEFREKLCTEKGISVYPVWAKDNQVLIGLQSFGKLSEFSGCPI